MRIQKIDNRVNYGSLNNIRYHKSFEQQNNYEDRLYQTVEAILKNNAFQELGKEYNYDVWISYLSQVPLSCWHDAYKLTLCYSGKSNNVNLENYSYDIIYIEKPNRDEAFEEYLNEIRNISVEKLKGPVVEHTQRETESEQRKTTAQKCKDYVKNELERRGIKLTRII